MAEPVMIVPYDLEWPKIFARLRDDVSAVMGAVALRIEHVGSTAVPGLVAKPVIDIDVVISSELELQEAISRLLLLGYSYAGERGIEGRHAFVQPMGLPTHHLYVCAADNPELARHIAFRNHLITDRAASDAYGELKQELARTFGEDREGYTNAKTAFIADILSKLAFRSGPQG
ncbi:GrpB family protein [Rhizobium sp. C4]|uniref:GrpB family protein n=1 Tax=Rhizobium sp. C4 TaxID=1349800 RepID=UPI001E44AB29|nr:GrpB family protein [Rhizobium sp. C4]MCD2173648.1 GrpB family protein [Rhizobium sp. C4]